MATKDHTPSEEGQGTAREPRPLTPQTPRGEATRQRILDAAEAVFGEQGYYEASISEITQRAGVAQGTFYIYFHSKREIFAELVVDLGDRLRAASRDASQDAPNRMAAERLGFAAFLDFVAQHRRVYQIVQEAERVVPEAARTYYQRISEGYQRHLAAAIAAGEIRAVDPEIASFALMGIAHFQALRWILWENHEDTRVSPEVLDAIMAFIAHGLAASE